MMGKVKQCPFCGGNLEIVTADVGPYKGFTRGFHRCKVLGYMSVFDWTKEPERCVDECWNIMNTMNTSTTHRTVEQWELEEGMTLPETAAVWLTIDSGLWVTGWELMTKEAWLYNYNTEMTIVVVHEHPLQEPPKSDWMPE